MFKGGRGGRQVDMRRWDGSYVACARSSVVICLDGRLSSAQLRREENLRIGRYMMTEWKVGGFTC